MDEQQCQKRVRDKSTAWPRYHNCTRKPWKDGFCKQHHPDTVAKRNEESAKRYEETRSVVVRLSSLNTLRAENSRLAARVAEMEGLLREVLCEDGTPACTCPEYWEQGSCPVCRANKALGVEVK